MSYTELLTPGKDSSPALQMGSPALLLAGEPDLLPHVPSPQPQPGSVKKDTTSPTAQSGAEESEQNSFVAAEGEESLHVAYADPKQDGELDRLKYLFHSGQEGLVLKAKEPWEVALDAEMTLPQLPGASASGKKAGGSRGGRGRRGRGRKSGRA